MQILSQQGIKEVTLLGQNVNSYADDSALQGQHSSAQADPDADPFAVYAKVSFCLSMLSYLQCHGATSALQHVLACQLLFGVVHCLMILPWPRSMATSKIAGQDLSTEACKEAILRQGKFTVSAACWLCHKK